MREIDAVSTCVLHAAPAPMPSAHPIAALRGDTWVTSTTSPSVRATADHSSHACSVRTWTCASDSAQPGGRYPGSARHSCQTSGGTSASGVPSSSP